MARQLLTSVAMFMTALRACLVLCSAALFVQGCAGASGDAPEEVEELLIQQIAHSPDGGQPRDAEGPPFQHAMEQCYGQDTSSEEEVHTVGRYLALGDRMMAVRVDIPRAPALARCIEDAVMRAAPPGWEQDPDALGCGSFAIDLGGPPPAARPGDIGRQYEAHQRGMAALMREVVQRGLLPSDHHLVREALAADPR